MLVERWAVVRWEFIAWHRWPGASGDRSYLGQYHRHKFHVELAITTTHNEREVEFHDLLDFGRYEQSQRISHRSDMSCESMCEAIAEGVQGRYPDRSVIVAVFEDGEVGARMRFDPEGE